MDDIETTIRYYANTLGFTQLSYSVEDGCAIVEKGSVRIMFSLPNARYKYQKPKLTGSLYFNTSDMETWWAKLKDSSDIVYPLKIFDFGMKEFAIHESDGYILQFGQPIENNTDN